MTEGPSDDQDLLRQIVSGNETAFDELYTRYQGRLYRFAWHMSMSSAVAEEITQEVFMLVITKGRKYDPAKGSVAAYLFGIARNLTRRAIEHSAVHDSITEEFLDTYYGGATLETDLVAKLSHSQCVRARRLTSTA